MQIIKCAKTIILQEERHLMEMDAAKRMASEAMFFIEESIKNNLYILHKEWGFMTLIM